MSNVKITYNAPVVLTFALAAVVVTLLPEGAQQWFVASPELLGAPTYVGLVTHILAHSGWAHLVGNLTFILLLGPILEERHGSLALLGMILVTALVTGLANLVLSDNSLIGASGIVFMMILLASTANIRAGEIPLTFIAVALVYLGGEAISSLRTDGISHWGHLVGGATGGALGFLGARRREPAPHGPEAG